jgi:hypothetical protein
VCALDALDAVLVLAVDDELEADELDEYDVAACSISSSRSDDSDLVDVVAVPVDAAVEAACGAVAANQAPRPRNDAALTAPVMRRARRAGCGFLVVVMCGACAHSCKTT